MWLALAAILASGTGGTSLAVMPLGAGDGVDARTADSITSAVAGLVRKIPDLRVVTRDEIQALLSLERQRDLLGCGNEACIAEIGGALGVDTLLAGSVSKLGGSWLVTLKAIDIAHAATAAQADRRLREGGLDEVLDLLPGMVGEMFPDRWPFGWVGAESDPPGIRVALDEKPLGRTPVHEVEVEPGLHTVSVADPCYEAASERVMVSRGQHQAPHLTTKTRVGTLDVAVSDSAGRRLAGELRLGDRVVGTVPGPVQVPRCTEAVAVRLPDGREWRSSVTLGDSPLALHAMFASPTPPPHEIGWKWLGAGAGLLAAGASLDYFPKTARNGRVDPLDFVPVALYVAAAGAAAIGLF